MGNHILHIVEILGVFFCVHHFWPKGVTYGEKEEWEKTHHRHRHSHAKRKHSSRGQWDESRGSPRNDYVARKEHRHRDKGDYEISERPVQERDHEYGGRPVHSRRSSFRDQEYDEPPVYSRRASSRY
jgi:hypothetical protein